ncbi:hypothetical protein [Opitutus sp. GAS368]|jgi:hypothetical protein|uniref:hypothetical protein n=1 Tax=Opitutus sp. GAS368 TaxID=1882749 RepID=UPI001E43A389|nr:hypothetical protein [Opitutus sp. GAS368]
MKESPWLLLAAIPGLLLAGSTFVVLIVWILCIADIFIGSYARVFRGGDRIELDKYQGLILPLDWLKKKMRAKTWWQLIIRIWLLGVALILASGSYFIVVGLLQKDAVRLVTIPSKN